ncbi:MAG: hypothetical protein Q7K57_16980 [Burkholderiaceae bacterium]|nr:hypothetical protein [Burkholderiaceae bacterium]
MKTKRRTQTSSAGLSARSAHIKSGKLRAIAMRTPADIVKSIQEECLKALKSNAITERFANDNAVGGGGSSAEFAKFIAGEQKIWSDIVKRAQIKAD